MSYDITDIADAAPSPKVDAWKPEVGDFHQGEIEWVAKTPWVKDDDLRNRTIASLKIVFGDMGIYPRTHIGPIGVTLHKLEELDSAPDNLMKAIVRAVKEAGKSSIEVGSTLAVKRVDDVPVEMNGRTFWAHDFVAKYTPAKGTKIDPFDTAGLSDAPSQPRRVEPDPVEPGPGQSQFKPVQQQQPTARTVTATRPDDPFA